MQEIDIATAQITDACIRLKLPYRVAPSGLKFITPSGKMIFGPVVPARHYGSVDVFLEALEAPLPVNGILVIDNGGRVDEACIGDLIVLEVKHAGLQAIIVWGLHRDTNDLIEIAFPVCSYGATPTGPTRLDLREPEALSSAYFGDFLVTKGDTAFVDADGAVFLETAHVEKVVILAKTIRNTEREQARSATGGLGLRQQFQFSEFLTKREASEAYTFRKHLSTIAKAIEE